MADGGTNRMTDSGKVNVEMNEWVTSKMRCIMLYSLSIIIMYIIWHFYIYLLYAANNTVISSNKGENMKR